jgi:hypothetical protein
MIVLTIGQVIVSKSKSPFADDNKVAEWIDFAIQEQRKIAANEEQERIEILVSKMIDNELLLAKQDFIRIHGDNE